MSALLPSATAVLLTAGVFAKVIGDFLRHHASLRSLERIIATSPDHAHLINDLVAAESGGRVEGRRVVGKERRTS
jgi:hypothetical protein